MLIPPARLGKLIILVSPMPSNIDRISYGGIIDNAASESSVTTRSACRIISLKHRAPAAGSAVLGVTWPLRCSTEYRLTRRDLILRLQPERRTDYGYCLAVAPILLTSSRPTLLCYIMVNLTARRIKLLVTQFRHSTMAILVLVGNTCLGSRVIRQGKHTSREYTADPYRYHVSRLPLSL